MTSCGLRTAAGPVWVALAVTGLGASVTVPMFARGLVVTGLGHMTTIPALVTTRGHVTGPFWPLTACGHG